MPTAQKVLLVTLVLTLLIGEAAGLFYLWVLRSPQQSVSRENTNLPPSSGNDYIFIKKSKSLSAHLLTLQYQGILRSKNNDEWMIESEGEKISFKINSKTRFLKRSSTGEDEINPTDIILGSPVFVSIGIVDVGKQDMEQKVAEGNLKDHNTLSVTELFTELP